MFAKSDPVPGSALIKASAALPDGAFLLPDVVRVKGQFHFRTTLFHPDRDHSNHFVGLLCLPGISLEITEFYIHFPEISTRSDLFCALHCRGVDLHRFSQMIPVEIMIGFHVHGRTHGCCHRQSGSCSAGSFSGGASAVCAVSSVCAIISVCAITVICAVSSVFVITIICAVSVLCGLSGLIRQGCLHLTPLLLQKPGDPLCQLISPGQFRGHGFFPGRPILFFRRGLSACAAAGLCSASAAA